MSENEKKDLGPKNDLKKSETHARGLSKKAKIGGVGAVLAVFGGGLIYGMVNDEQPSAKSDPSSPNKVLPKTDSSGSVIDRYKDSEDKKNEKKTGESKSIIDQITGGSDKSILDALDDKLSDKKSPLNYGRSSVADAIQNAINGEQSLAATDDKKKDTSKKKEDQSTPVNLSNNGNKQEGSSDLDNPIVIPTPNPVLPGPEQPTPIPTPTPTPTPDPGPTPPTPVPDKVVTLECQSKVMTHVGSSLNLKEYAWATDSDGVNVSAGITFSTNVNFNKEGNYSVTYYYVNSNGRQEVSMQIIVVNDAPIINGVHDSRIEVGSSFDPKAGVTATDTESGDLTSGITVTGSVDSETPGTYLLTYAVTDAHGKTTTVNRTVAVYVTSPSFNGVGDKTIELGESFDPRAGVSVSDNYGTSDFTVEGTVDTDTQGTYELTYKAINKYGKETTVKRVITVAAAAPEITGVSDLRIEVGTPFDPMAGVSANDKYGAVSVSVTSNNVDVNTVGVYEVVYEATNTHSVTATAKRKVEVFADAPTLTVPSKYEVQKGSSFDPKSLASATDKYGPVEIQVEGSVDTNTAGLYSLKFSATNKHGVTSTAHTTVEVLASEALSMRMETSSSKEELNPVDGVKQSTPPVIAGAGNLILDQGSSFNDMQDVVIIDLYGNFKVDIVGSVNTSVPGNYSLTYTVTNIYGQTAQVVRTITVNPIPIQPTIVEKVVEPTAVATEPTDVNVQPATAEKTNEPTAAPQEDENDQKEDVSSPEPNSASKPQ